MTEISLDGTILLFHSQKADFSSIGAGFLKDLAAIEKLLARKVADDLLFPVLRW